MKTKIIGLAGQIGSGKSLAAAMLKEMGAALIDADELGRQAVEPGRPAYTDICAAFGADYLLADGSLNRKALAALVFNDDPARRLLNEITHPRIRAEAEKLIARYRAEGHKVIVLEAAILIGSSFAAVADEIWLVTAPLEQIYGRLNRRDGLSQAETAARLASQLPVEKQAAAADRIIINDGNEQKLRGQLEVLFNCLLQEGP
jgi:dephospho-CoA kinase